MAKIDKMLEMITARNVERAILVGDRPFQLFAAGRKAEGSVTPNAQLQELANEITPPQFAALLRDGGTFHFVYGSPHGRFDIGVEKFVGQLQITISPSKSNALSSHQNTGSGIVMENSAPAQEPYPGGYGSAPASPPRPPAPSLPHSPSTTLQPARTPLPPMQQPVPAPDGQRELFVHKDGQNLGPMSPEKARDEVQNGRLSLFDMAIAPHMQKWDSLQNVLDTFDATPHASVNTVTVVPTKTTSPSLLRSFLNEEQDPSAVERVMERLEQICTPDETILYIAVQKKPVVTFAPVCVALTSKRVIVFRPTMMGLGLTFQDFNWRVVADIHISESLLGSTFSVRLTNNGVVVVDSLPKAQARKLYQFGQQMEEKMHSHRRDLMLEEKRAGAGGVNVSVNNGFPQAPQQPLPPAPSSSAGDDPMAKLQKLKTMLEAGLITQAEYDSKKAEIMASF